MKEILEKMIGKEIQYISFQQTVSVYPKQYKDGEIYETEVCSEEPLYRILFKDGSEEEIILSDLLEKMFKIIMK